MIKENKNNKINIREIREENIKKIEELKKMKRITKDKAELFLIDKEIEERKIFLDEFNEIYNVARDKYLDGEYTKERFTAFLFELSGTSFENWNNLGVNRRIELKEEEIKEVRDYFFKNNNTTKLQDFKVDLSNVNTYRDFTNTISKIDLNKIFYFLKDIKNKDSFNCFFIKNNTAVLYNNNYVSYNNVENTYYVFNIYFLFKILYDFNIYQSVNFISKYTNSIFDERLFFLQELEKYNENIRIIEELKTIIGTENLYKYTKSYLDVLLLINEIGLRKLETNLANVNNKHMFFASASYLETYNKEVKNNLYNMYNSKVRKGLVLFTTLGLLERVNYKTIKNDDNMLNLSLLKEAEKYKDYKDVCFYTIPQYTLEVLMEATKIVELLKKNKIKSNKISKKTLLGVLPVETIDKIYNYFIPVTTKKEEKQNINYNNNIDAYNKVAYFDFEEDEDLPF